MTLKDYSITLTPDLLLELFNSDDFLASLAKNVLQQIMEMDVSRKLSALKSERTAMRTGHRSGYRQRKLNTRLGTLSLNVPKLRSGGYVPFFLERYKRSEAALIDVIQEAYLMGVSTRKMDNLVKCLGIDGMSHAQVSEITKGLNEQAEAFRNRSLLGHDYPVIWVDALYEKIRYGGSYINMAVLIVCGVNENGRREVIAIEPMPDESEDSYTALFQKLKERGMNTPKLVISDAHAGLKAGVSKGLSGSIWQRCKVHFMRNIMAHIPQKDKETFAVQLKEIWSASTEETARKRAKELTAKCAVRYPKAARCLEEGLDDSLAYFAFPQLDAKKISGTNMLERLNEEIRRRTRVVGVFTSEQSYVKLVTMLLIEQTEDWAVGRAYLNPESIRLITEKAVA